MKNKKYPTMLFEPKKIKLSEAPALKVSALKHIVFSPYIEKDALFVLKKAQNKMGKNMPMEISRSMDGLSIFIGLKNVKEKALRPPRKPEAFSIKISRDGVLLNGFDRAGLFYAVQTFFQMLEDADELPAMEIQDWPDIAMRAYHLDLKKGVQRKPELFSFIDRLAELRINTVFLEYENRFKYKAHPRLAASDALSADDAKKLLEHARMRHMKIIPLLQPLGHVEYVLQDKEYAHLREMPDALSQYCPSNPESFKLFKSFFDELLEVHGDSEYFHVGGDETGLLGRCPACKKFADKKGKTELYSSYMNKVCKLVLDSGKKPIVWDDMLTRSGEPEQLKKLPKGTVVMYWDYREKDSAQSQFLLKGSRISKKWHESINSARDFADAPKGFSGYWEDLPEKVQKAYLPYLNDKNFPLKGKLFPYIELIKDKGYDVIGGASLRCGRDRVLPHTSEYMSNIKNWAIRGKEAGATGIVVTSWAAASTFGPPACSPSLCDHLLAASGAFFWNSKTDEKDFCRNYDLLTFGIEGGAIQQALRLESLTPNETYCNWIENIERDLESLADSVKPEGQKLFEKYLAAIKIACFERTVRSTLRKVEDRFYPGSPAGRQREISRGASKNVKRLSKELKRIKNNFRKIIKRDFSGIVLDEAVNAVFALTEAKLKAAEFQIKAGK